MPMFCNAQGKKKSTQEGEVRSEIERLEGKIA